MKVITDLPVIAGDPFSDAEICRPGQIDAHIRDAGELVFVSSHGILATGRHEICREILRNWQVFTSTGGTGIVDIRKDGWRVPSVILDTDPPDHNRARGVLNDILSLRSLEQFKAQTEAQADRMVRDLAQRGQFDAAADLAKALPMAVLPDAVGLQQDGRDHLLRYASLNFNSLGPRNAIWQKAEEHARESVAWVTQQCARENLAPGGFGAAIYAHADTGTITPAEAGLLVRTFLSAGLDTTIYGIGNAIRALAENPDQWDLLRADPTRAAAAFEETLRLHPPSHLVGRTVAKDTSFRGTPLREGQKVLLFIAAGNRDPRAFDRPDVFDIARRTRGHLSFGVGVHGCVGQVIARLEAVAVLTAMARHFRAIDLNGKPELTHTNWLRGHARLPVSVIPA
ncbi:MAG: cytochrome P450 [Rhodobacteraceae bacterium]|nr:cytochrome P450 [Paracoccaceae bacterium]